MKRKVGESKSSFAVRVIAAEKKQLRTEKTKLKGQIQEMVEKAAAKHLPAYREQGAKMAAQAQEILELKAKVNELREVMLDAVKAFDSTYADIILMETLHKTPTQSLQAHNAAIEDEVIERCKEEVATYYGSGAGSIALANLPRKYKEQ